MTQNNTSSPVSHFLDIGANVGQTFDDFLAKTTEFDGWRIHCFEPSPRHLPALMAKAKEMSGRFDIKICPFGIRGASGIQSFWQKDDPRGDSFEHYLASDHETVNLAEGYELLCPHISLANFVLRYTAPGDRVIVKIDAEGSEYDMLAALLNEPDAFHRIDKIMVEFHTVKLLRGAMNADALKVAYAQRGKPLGQWMY